MSSSILDTITSDTPTDGRLYRTETVSDSLSTLSGTPNTEASDKAWHFHSFSDNEESPAPLVSRISSAFMEVSFLFRLLCGFRCGTMDRIIWPALEILGIWSMASFLSFPFARSVGGLLQILSNITMIVSGGISRRWVTRNQDALEMYFKVTSRQVSACELLIGGVYFLLYLALVSQNMVRYFYQRLYIKLALSPIIYYLLVFRFVWIHFIFLLLFTDVIVSLRRDPTGAHLENYKQCCRLLSSMNTLLNALQDWLLFSSALSLINLASLAMFTKCNLRLNWMSWALLVIVPNVVSVAQGDRISAAMHGKRAQIRNMRAEKTDANDEAFTVLGHRNALGIRWIADSDCMNFSSALLVATNIAAYAGLILTTPLFEAGFNKFYCWK